MYDVCTFIKTSFKHCILFLKELEGNIESLNNDQQSVTINNSESLALTEEVRVLIIILSNPFISEITYSSTCTGSCSLVCAFHQIDAFQFNSSARKALFLIQCFDSRQPSHQFLQQDFLLYFT